MPTFVVDFDAQTFLNISNDFYHYPDYFLAVTLFPLTQDAFQKCNKSNQQSHSQVCGRQYFQR